MYTKSSQIGYYNKAYIVLTLRGKLNSRHHHWRGFKFTQPRKLYPDNTLLIQPAGQPIYSGIHSLPYCCLVTSETFHSTKHFFWMKEPPTYHNVECGHRECCLHCCHSRHYLLSGSANAVLSRRQATMITQHQCTAVNTCERMRQGIGQCS